ncbi:MAG: hypothetical protein ACLQA5_04685 [Solirubrobacteraceae bacterium]
MVTLLTVPLLELPLLELPLLESLLEPEFEDEPVLVPDVVVDVVVAGDELDATVLADERLASAGSCPDTSTIVIKSQEATNSATAPLMMRRRIIRVRLTRAALIAWPRARASCGSLSVIVVYLVVGHRRGMKHVGSFDPAHLSRVRND